MLLRFGNFESTVNPMLGARNARIELEKHIKEKEEWEKSQRIVLEKHIKAWEEWKEWKKAQRGCGNKINGV